MLMLEKEVVEKFEVRLDIRVMHFLDKMSKKLGKPRATLAALLIEKGLFDLAQLERTGALDYLEEFLDQ